jgi:DNA-binding SARP family transcriptional activator
MRMNESRFVTLTLLGGFSCPGTADMLPLAAQRLLAFLALREGGVHRAAAAERLWPDSSPARAAANLRSALWLVRSRTAVLIDCAGPCLQISPTTRVDQFDVLARANQITALPSSQDDMDVSALVENLRKELLPGWFDDWLLLEQERWDQVRLHTLELLARQLLSAKRYLPALETALTAIAIEPVRETSHRTVIEVHVAEGNAACALKHFQRYRAMLQREVGVAPSPRMISLVRELTPTRAGTIH